jgi:hypothetical protein
VLCAQRIAHFAVGRAFGCIGQQTAS